MKHTITLTIKEYLDKNEFFDLVDAISSIVEYAPDWGFPDNVDQESIQESAITYSPDGKELILEFTYDVEVDDEDEDEESEESDD